VCVRATIFDISGGEGDNEPVGHICIYINGSFCDTRGVGISQAAKYKKKGGDKYIYNGKRCWVQVVGSTHSCFFLFFFSKYLSK
jgi:hypothetical protein